QLGLVCFRLKGSDELNQKLLSNINESGRLHMVPASVNEKYVIRFCAVAQNATEDDVDHAWEVITEFASELLETQHLEKVASVYYSGVAWLVTRGGRTFLRLLVLFIWRGNAESWERT
ncbi:unnamed protein product, partial [Timema podura]|nr:unnamed protein product [Timema podura]